MKESALSHVWFRMLARKRRAPPARLRPFMSDLGLTHIALPAADVEASAAG
jgi:hypothetical protein